MTLKNIFALESLTGLQKRNDAFIRVGSGLHSHCDHFYSVSCPRYQISKICRRQSRLNPRGQFIIKIDEVYDVIQCTCEQKKFLLGCLYSSNCRSIAFLVFLIFYLELPSTQHPLNKIGH